MPSASRITLCVRCEHRAEAMENGYGLRCECSDFDRSVTSCYMFQPCKLLKLEKSDKTDKRDMLGPPMISSRVHAVGLSEGTLNATREGNQVVLWRESKKSGKKKT